MMRLFVCFALTLLFIAQADARQECSTFTRSTDCNTQGECEWVKKPAEYMPKTPDEFCRTFHPGLSGLAQDTKTTRDLNCNDGQTRRADGECYCADGTKATYRTGNGARCAPTLTAEQAFCFAASHDPEACKLIYRRCSWQPNLRCWPRPDPLPPALTELPSVVGPVASKSATRTWDTITTFIIEQLTPLFFGALAIALTLAFALHFARKSSGPSDLAVGASHGMADLKDDLLTLIPVAGRIPALLRIGETLTATITTWLRTPPDLPTLTPDERTKNAQWHLTNASTYFEKWLTEKDWNDKRRFVRFAAEQIEEAKKYDINATVTTVGPDKQPETSDIKQLSATALFYEAQNLINEHRYGKAVKVLNYALEFEPDNTQYLNKMAEALIKNKDRRTARAVLKKVKYPDFRTQELLDRLRTDSFLGNPFSPTVLYLLFGVACFVGAFMLFDKADMFAWWPIILVLLGWAAFYNVKQIGIENTLKRQGKWPRLTRPDHEI